MNEVFADTSGWANYFVRSEPFHDEAKRLVREWYAQDYRVVTTNYVLLELVALFTNPLRISRPRLVKAIETIKTSSWVEIVHIDKALDQEAWDLLKARLDKDYSLVDCASMIVMQNRGVVEAFTNDHHFEQAGFSICLK